MSVSNDSKAVMNFVAKSRSLPVAYLYWFVLGFFGAHRFYLGKTKSAVIMLILNVIGLLTMLIVVGYIFLLAVAIWWIVDAFLLPGMVSKYNQNLMNSFDSTVKSPQ